MTEHPAEHSREHVDHPERSHPEGTGNETVDAVLESLEGLDDRPASEHVAVFESAHDRLRGVLSDAGSDPGNNTAG